MYILIFYSWLCTYNTLIFFNKKFKKYLFLSKNHITFVSVFHRILDFKAGLDFYLGPFFYFRPLG
jgi:hypothetical protein